MLERSEPPTWTTEQLYDLFILGLSWVCDESSLKTITRSGVRVFHALHFAGAIGEAQRKKAATNLELIRLFECYAELDDGGMPRQCEQVRVILAASGQLVIVFVPPREFVNRARYFGAKGYPLGIAPAGRTYAESIEPVYTEFITPASFFEGWQKYFNQAGAMQDDDV